MLLYPALVIMPYAYRGIYLLYLFRLRQAQDIIVTHVMWGLSHAAAAE